VAGASIITFGSGEDPENDPLDYAWFLDGARAGVGPLATNELSMGCHTLTLRVSDGLLTSSTDLQICTISAGQRLQNSIDLVAGSAIGRLNKRPLLADLEAAVASFDRGNFTAGVNQLEAFENKVQAEFKKGGPDQANLFIENVQQVIDALDCPPPSLVMSAVRVAGATLVIHRINGRLGVSWSDPGDLYVVESCDDLSMSGKWQPITSGISAVNGSKSLSLTNGTGGSAHFFRLRQRSVP
jgi:hypothetical protein